MLDRAGITKRFISCFPDLEPAELARLFDVTPPTVFQWLSGVRAVPWIRLKALADTQAVSWDWLIGGRAPKFPKAKKTCECQSFDRHGINQRFLSLYPGMSQKTLGELLNVTPVAVFRWRHDLRQVPWEKLKYAVETQGVTWEWLLEGR